MSDALTSELRSIEGSIDSDGKVIKGTGFTVTRINIGAYIVKFIEPFYFSAPQVQTLEVSNPFVPPYGYMAEVIGKPSTSEFKYFTYELQDHDLIMRDLPINYFCVYGFKNPAE